MTKPHNPKLREKDAAPASCASCRHVWRPEGPGKSAPGFSRETIAGSKWQEAAPEQEREDQRRFTRATAPKQPIEYGPKFKRNQSFNALLAISWAK